MDLKENEKTCSLDKERFEENSIPTSHDDSNESDHSLSTPLYKELNMKLVIQDSQATLQPSNTEIETFKTNEHDKTFDSSTGCEIGSTQGLIDRITLSKFDSTVKSVVVKLKSYTEDKRKVQMKQELSIEILQHFQMITSCVEDVNEDSVKEMCSILTADPTIMKSFYTFLSEVFEAFRGGLDPYHIQCVVLLHGLIVMLTEKSQELSKFIVNSGLLMEHIDQLCKMKESSINQEVVQFFVQLNISAIYNCTLSTAINSYFLAPEFNCVPIFRPYATSSYDDVRLHSKFILGSLSELLSHDEVDELLQLTISEMTSFLEAFECSTTNNSHAVHCLNSVFSLAEAVLSLNSLLVNDKNCEMIITKNVVPALFTLLACGTISEQISGCQLIWNLLLSPKYGLKFRQQLMELSIEDCLRIFLESKSSSLSLLSSCLLFLLDSDGVKDVSQYIQYAKGCYIYAHYSECKEVCENVLQSNSNTQEDQDRAKYFLGKAFFKIYQKLNFQLRTMRQLQLQFMQEYQELHKRCCEMMKSTIGLLGAALDHGIFDHQGKDEGFTMLNSALIDYIKEAKDPGRCLLCLQKRKLRNSHYFPKSLLDDFSRGAVTPIDRKIFRPSIDFRGIDKSPKEMVYPMFCFSCENHFGRYGETQFHPQFFSRIYDEKDLSHTTSEQNIEYGEWLYQFCIGILFRGIIVRHENIFINTSQLCELFQRLREIICSFSPETFPHFRLSSCDAIPVAVFINPPEPRPEDCQYPFMMKVLNSILNYVYIQGPLYSDSISRPHHIHCLMVHFGMINIVVPVDPHEFKNVPHENLIDLSGGVFRVPSILDRANNLPKGIWKAFQHMAVGSENDILRWPEKARLAFEKKNLQQPAESAKQLFRLVESSEKSAHALKSNITPSNIPNISKQANFLPDQFLIGPSYSPSSVFLPSGHTILVHRNFPHDSERSDSGETLFLAIGRNKPYTLDKPYVIYHYFEPGLQLDAGFLVSPADLSAQDFLPDVWPKELKERLEWSLIENARSVCHRMLPQVLEVKGILNCAALLKRVQSHGQTFSEMPSYDGKCQPQCWYCKELCHVCMKQSSFGHTVRRNDGSVLRFCSEACQMFCADEVPPLILKVWEPVEFLPQPQFQARCIEESHKELLYVLIQGKLSSGQYCKINMVLVSGDGHMHYPINKVYVVYYLRTLDEQQCMEFFLGDDLHPEEVLLYAASEDADVALARRRSTNEIKNLVSMALAMKGYASLQQLLEKCAV